MTETERGSIEKDPLCARVRAIRPQLRESGAYSTLVLSLYRKRDTGQLVMLHLLGRYAAGRTASDAGLDLPALAERAATPSLPAVTNSTLSAREIAFNVSLQVDYGRAPYVLLMAWARPMPPGSTEKQRLHYAWHVGGVLRKRDGRMLTDDELYEADNDEGYGLTFHDLVIVFDTAVQSAPPVNKPLPG